METQMRIFYANRKDDERCDEDAEALKRLFAREFPDRKVQITTGKADFFERANDMGGWKVWTDDVIEGTIEVPSVIVRRTVKGVCTTEPATRVPRFTHMVVPDKTIGKATKDMIDGFIAGGKQVIYWDRNVTCAVVVGIEESGSRGKGGPSWKDGWQLVFASPVDDQQDGE